jgi:hypothetical protein
MVTSPIKRAALHGTRVGVAVGSIVDALVAVEEGSSVGEAVAIGGAWVGAMRVNSAFTVCAARVNIVSGKGVDSLIGREQPARTTMNRIESPKWVRFMLILLDYGIVYCTTRYGIPNCT